MESTQSQPKEGNAVGGVIRRPRMPRNQRLALFIKEKFKTNAAFAREVGTSRSRISQIVNGLHPHASQEIKNKIAEKLGLSVLVCFPPEYETETQNAGDL